MRKNLLLLVLFSACFSLCGLQKAVAQKHDLNLIMGGNVILGFPAGDFKNGYSSATGVDAFLGFGMSRQAFLVGTIGYSSYKNEDTNPYGKIKLIPLKAGLRLYPAKKLFVAGNAGVGFLKDETMSSRESRFVYDFGLGLHGQIVQAGVYYDGWKRKNNNGTSNTIQLRIGLALR
jgi:hypothetical protein